MTAMNFAASCDDEAVAFVFQREAIACALKNIIGGIIASGTRWKISFNALNAFVALALVMRKPMSAFLASSNWLQSLIGCVENDFKNTP